MISHELLFAFVLFAAVMFFTPGPNNIMGLEGAVKLAYRNELAKIEDPAERRRKYEEMVAQMYERGKALSISTIFGVDDTIDPADTRQWLASLLRSLQPRPRGEGKRRSAIDAW